jgi:hypothetical protein
VRAGGRERTCCATPKLPRLPINSGVRVAKHDHRAADRNLRVQYLPIGMGDSKELHRAERLLIEGNGIRGTIDVDVRNNGVSITFRSHDHVGPPGKI